MRLLVYALLAIRIQLTEDPPTMTVLLLFLLTADGVNARFLRSPVYSTLLGITAAATALFQPAFIVMPAIPLFDLAAETSPRKSVLPVALVLLATSAVLVLPVVLSLVLSVAPGFGPDLTPAEILGPIPLIASALLLGYGQYRGNRAIRHARRFSAIARRSRHEREDERRAGKRLTRDIVQSVELQERERISHALHDTVGHRLTGVLMQVQAARKLLERPHKADTVPERLDRCVHELAETLRLMRETVHDLRPRSTTARERIERAVRSFSFCPTKLSIDPAATKVNPALLHEMARTVEEALTNIARHSGASEASVALALNDGDLTLTVGDNGAGCTTIREGLGLRGIRTRIEARHGTATVESDVGFLLRVSLPAAGATDSMTTTGITVTPHEEVRNR